MLQENNKYDVLIAGGGAAGMMAASAAASSGARCILLEAGDRLGRKILISGKGRCNITNDCSVEGTLENVRRNREFLYSSLYSFSNSDIVEYFGRLGVRTKVERGGRVFPVSDKAYDVVYALEKDMESKGVHVVRNAKVRNLITKEGTVYGAEDYKGVKYYADKVILACGGSSYSATGSDGNGFLLAERLGHKVNEPKGVLTGLECSDKWPQEAMGLSLKNVNLTIIEKSRKIFSIQGEMLFTHYGISGPIVLTASSSLHESDFLSTRAVIDLKPAMDEDKLDKRLLRDFAEYSRKDFANSLSELLPRKLIPIIVELSGIEETKKINQITSPERRSLARLIKGMPLVITGTRPIEEAIVTAGGVTVDSINPSTMESKVLKNLYFCGEMIDVDANTGGYNLTIAFSTGHLAGVSAAGGL